MDKIEYKKIRLLLSALLIICLPVLIESYFLLIEGSVSVHDLLGKSFFASFAGSVKGLRFIMIFCLTSISVFVLNYFNRKAVFGYLYQFRYLISGIIFLLLVIGEIHGSSILFWQNLFNGSEQYNTLIGVSRAVRSDEWAVNTPMMLSQYFNKSGLFPYFSETIRGGLTDAFIIYGQPVRNIAVIFRPFHWGYLMLSPAKGLSFFWMGRTMGLFLVSFEFAMILSKKHKILSVLYAFLMTWAPIVQWWFAVNGLVEMLIFGQLVIVISFLYIRTENYWWRGFFAFVLFICAGGYALAFYPAWQIPLAYVFLALFIGLVLENRKNIKWHKKDTLIMAILIMTFGLAMAYIISLSYDTILSVLGTVYPGSRFETGGGQFFRFFLYPGNLFFASPRTLPLGNVSELAVFFDFFPMGIGLALWVLIKEKKRDVYLILLLVSLIILSGFCIFAWPDWLAKISLLSFTQPSRVFLAVGFLNLLLLIRSLTIIETDFSKLMKLIFSIILGSLITAMSMSVYQGYITMKMGLLIAPMLCAIFYIILSWRKVWAQKTFLGLSIGIVFISGMFANPVVSGLGVIYNQDIINDIHEVVENNDGLWIVDSGAEMGYPLINIPIMIGAPTINSTNVYPNLERWHLLDPGRSDEDIYNRYAHISIDLIGDAPETKFVLNSADLFTVQLKTADLKVLKVRYVLSKRDLSPLSNDSVKFSPLKSGNGFVIYEIKYI
ncbi:MAG: DUF7657 domain-containing protein [Acetobacterium sp.]